MLASVSVIGLVAVEVEAIDFWLCWACSFSLTAHSSARICKDRMARRLQLQAVLISSRQLKLNFNCRIAAWLAFVSLEVASNKCMTDAVPTACTVEMGILRCLMMLALGC